MNLKWKISFIVLLLMEGVAQAQGGFSDASVNKYLPTYALVEPLDKEENLTNSAHKIGVQHLTLSNFDSALFYFKASYEIRKLTGDRQGEVTSLQFLGRTCLEMGETNGGVDYLRQALAVAKKIQAKNQELETYRLLFEAFEKLNEPALAYQYIKAYTSLKDSLIKETIQNRMENALATHILEQRDEVLTRKTQEIRTIYVMSIIGAFFALAVLLWLVYSKLSQQYLLNDELKQKNLLIEQQAQQMEAFLVEQRVRQKKSNKARESKSQTTQING